MTDVQQLFEVVLGKHPGQKMTIELWHHTTKRTVTVTLGARKSQ